MTDRFVTILYRSFVSSWPV